MRSPPRGLKGYYDITERLAAFHSAVLLTLHPEHAHSVLAGAKTEEYRSWSTAHRGPLVIHSARPDGCLLCLVDLVDVLPDVYEGFVWLLANVRPLERVKVRGRQGLWNVDDDLVRVLGVNPEPR